MSDTDTADAADYAGPTTEERLEHALRLLASARASNDATGALIRMAMTQVANERERAVRAEQECARLRQTIGELTAAPQDSAACGDPVVERVVAMLRSRARLGMAKYKTTLARTDLDEAGWLKHATEEAADWLLYTRRAWELACQDGLSERGA